MNKRSLAAIGLCMLLVVDAFSQEDCPAMEDVWRPEDPLSELAGSLWRVHMADFADRELWPNNYLGFISEQWVDGELVVEGNFWWIEDEALIACERVSGEYDVDAATLRLRTLDGVVAETYWVFPTVYRAKRSPDGGRFSGKWHHRHATGYRRGVRDWGIWSAELIPSRSDSEQEATE